MNNIKFKISPKTIKLDVLDGHLVLYCKGHYINEIKNDNDYMEGFKRIWGVRCGISYDHLGNSLYEYIADKLFEILQKTLSDTQLYHFNKFIHKELAQRENDIYNWYPHNFTILQKLIWIYKIKISQLQINETKTNTCLILLPKPQPGIFNRIVKGEYEYNDYAKIINLNIN